jgi:hypothetical protein
MNTQVNPIPTGYHWIVSTNIKDVNPEDFDKLTN